MASRRSRSTTRGARPSSTKKSTKKVPAKAPSSSAKSRAKANPKHSNVAAEQSSHARSGATVEPREVDGNQSVLVLQFSTQTDSEDVETLANTAITRALEETRSASNATRAGSSISQRTGGAPKVFQRGSVLVRVCH